MDAPWLDATYDGFNEELLKDSSEPLITTTPIKTTLMLKSLDWRDVQARHPSHYTRGNIEVWDFIRDQGLNYFRGNAIKYICRAGFKSPATEIEDLKKAIHYLENELQNTHAEREPERSSGAVSDSIWVKEWDRETDYATGFDR